MVNQTERILIPQVDYFFLGETVRQIFLKEKVTSDRVRNEIPDSIFCFL